jgi:hypothetical protein
MDVQAKTPKANSNSDGFVKSRYLPKDGHSGLSGIILFQRVAWQIDSRQAGMTTFYKSINSILLSAA